MFTWSSSTSTTTSDFALSFTSMRRSATATLSAVSRMTIAFSCGIVPSRRRSRIDRTMAETSFTSPFDRKNVRMTRSSYSLRFCCVSCAMRIVFSSMTL